MKRLTSTPILALAIATLTSLHAQLTVGVEVLEGNVDYTTCTDPFDEPDPGWGVQVEGQEWVYFDGHHSFCSFPTLPFLIYQQTYPVAAALPDSIQVCLMTGEHDPNLVFFINCANYACWRTTCEKFKLPPIGSEIIEELVLPAGSVSGGYTKVRIFVEGEPVMVDGPKCILTESYGTFPQDTSNGNDIVVNDDGSSVIAGTWNSKAYVMRIDADGEMMTFRNLGPLIGDGNSIGLAIEKVAAGGYAVAGEWIEITPTDTFTRVFLLRLDENLDPIPGIPVLILGAEGIYQNGNRHSPVLLALPDGVLLATSIVLGGGVNWEDIALTKYSFDLSPQWTTFHSTGFFEAVTGLVQTSQGFAMTIDRAFLNSMVVRRVSDTGIGLDNTMVTALNINDLEYDPADDKLLAVGRTYPQDSTRTVIYRIDANTGTLEDSSFIKHGINNVPADIVRCDDGNMLIGINTSQPGAFGGYFWSAQFFTINPATFEVLAQDSMVNPNSLISNLLSRIQPLNCDGSRRVATGRTGIFADIKTIFYKRKFCSDKITSSNSLCAGETVTLTAPADGTSYLWSTGETTQEITVETPGQYWVKVTYGCDSLSDTIQLEQLAPPLAAFNYSVDNLTVTFSDSSQNASSWLWNFGDGTTSTESEPEHTFAADGLYTVVLIASNDCGSDTASITIEVGSTPTAGFSASDTIGCAPFTVQFTNLSSANATSFQWTFEGGNPATSTEANPTVTFENPGTYDVTLVATNALGSVTLIAPDYIHVLDKPVAAFSANVTDLSVSFSNASLNASSWLWNFGDGTTSTESEPEHTFAADGLYSVVLIASNDCGSDTASITIEVGSTPTADFSASDTLGCAPFTVQFTNLSSANATSFLWTFEGGNPATSTEANPTVTFENPGSFDVTLVASNALGSFTLIAPDYIHVLDKPVAAFSANVTDLSVSFSNASLNASSWLWNFGDGTTSTESEPEHTFAADGLYSVVLIASNDCGSDTASITIEVGSTPTADFSASDTLGCAPFTVQFTNLSSANATSFLWTFEGGNPATSTEANPTVTFENPGSFDVTLVASNALGSFTLIAPDYIRVLDLPTAAFSANANGLSVSFSNASQNATTWLWNFGDGTTSTEPEPEHTFAADGLYSVVLIASNDCGSDTASITIEVGSTPTADFSASDTLGCAPFTVQFTNLSSANATSFLWTFEGGNPATSTEANPTITFINPGSFDVTLVASNALGSVTLIAPDYIRVLDLPTAAFSANANGLSVSFSNASQNATTWLWNFGDGTTSTEPEPEHTFAADGLYSVVLIASNDCGSDTASITIEVGSTPTADFSASDTLGCAPFTVQFTNLSSANATSFLWTFEGGNPATSTEANPTVTFENPGWYDVKLKATNALGTSTLLIENYIHVLGAPTANFSSETDGLTVTFTDLSNDATSWEWEFGDGETSTEQNPVHTYAAPGEYSVLLTVHNECGMASIEQKITVEPNATLEELGLERFIVYPNPNGGRFTLQLETVKSLSCRILIANVLGEVILRDVIDATPGSTLRQYELNNVPSGMYFLQLQASGKTALHRLVIAK